MERTNHTMIVGDGARRFAVAEGFRRTEFVDGALTQKSGWRGKASTSFKLAVRALTVRSGSAAQRLQVTKKKRQPQDAVAGWIRRNSASSLRISAGHDQALMARAIQVISDPPTGNDQLPGSE